MIVLLTMLFFTNSLDEFKNISRIWTDFKTKDTLYIAIFFIIGAIYYICNIRNILWRPFLKKVQNNIKNKLLNPFKENLTSDQIKELKKDRKLMHIFYNFVDSDTSLTEKAKRVRFNGLIWTSTIDLAIISILGSIFFFMKLIFIKSNYDLIVALLLLLLSIISFVLIILTTKRHISLSNVQLDFICHIYKHQLNQKINESLQ